MVEFKTLWHNNRLRENKISHEDMLPRLKYFLNKINFFQIREDKPFLKKLSKGNYPQHQGSINCKFTKSQKEANFSLYNKKSELYLLNNIKIFMNFIFCERNNLKYCVLVGII